MRKHSSIEIDPSPPAPARSSTSPSSVRSTHQVPAILPYPTTEAHVVTYHSTGSNLSTNRVPTGAAVYASACSIPSSSTMLVAKLL